MMSKKFFRSAGMVLTAGSILASAAVLSACGDDDDDAESSTPTTAAGATMPVDSASPTMGSSATMPADSASPTMGSSGTMPAGSASPMMGGNGTMPAGSASPMMGGNGTMTAQSETFTAGDIEVTNVRARATTNPNSAVFMNITSTGEADRLVSASVAEDVAVETQVHETIVDGSSMKMQELEDGLPIPADGMVELKSGGYHVMLLDLKEPLVAGEELTVTLEFEKAGSLEIIAPIMDIAGGGMMR